MENIKSFVSNLDKNVFALYGLPEEVIAVLFAYYSRSKDDLRTNLNKLLQDDLLNVNQSTNNNFSLAQDKAKSFHEKWVVGYGHSSVAEHANIHLAVENVSIIGSKVIEDLRLGSYTEKSTRYVVFDTKSYAKLNDLPEHLNKVYEETCENLFSVYLDSFPKVQKWVEEQYPQKEGQAKNIWESVIRSKTCDLLRGLLPAGTCTNLGISANARSMETLLGKMLINPVQEVRDIAQQMFDESKTIVPTLLKHVKPNEFRKSWNNEIVNNNCVKYQGMPSDVRILKHDNHAFENILAAALYENDNGSIVELYDSVCGLSQFQKHGFMNLLLSNRGKYDPVPRAFENASITAELVLDYGAYRDLQRHRMLSPYTKLLTCQLGAELPTDELKAAGVYDSVCSALDGARKAWETIYPQNPYHAQYVVPMAYRIRTLWRLNIRELFHVVELRSGKQGHASYRFIAQELYREAIRCMPWLKDFIRVDLNSYSLARDKD